MPLVVFAYAALRFCPDLEINASYNIDTYRTYLGT